MAVAVPPFPIARFSVEQYHRMIESGAFTEDDRLELLEGWAVRKTAKGPAHEFVTGQLEALLVERVPSGWHVRNQAPITLSESEPEPDLSIARGTRSDYRARHPGAADVALVIEVSDSTLSTDRLKASTYAAAGIAEYWIVNLVNRCIERHRNPDTASAAYQTHETLGEDQAVSIVLEGVDCGSLGVGDILP